MITKYENNLKKILSNKEDLLKYLNVLSKTYKYDFKTGVILYDIDKQNLKLATKKFWESIQCKVNENKSINVINNNNDPITLFNIDDVTDTYTNNIPKFHLFEFDLGDDYISLYDYSKSLSIQIKEKYDSIDDIFSNIAENIIYSNVYVDLNEEERLFYFSIIKQTLANKLNYQADYINFQIQDTKKAEEILITLTSGIRYEIDDIINFIKNSKNISNNLKNQEKENIENKKENIQEKETVENKISQKNIDDELLKGSGFENGKYRIYEFFKDNHTDKEKIDFLKNEYGIGGHSTPHRGDFINMQHHDASGIQLEKTSENYTDTLHLKWNEISKRIEHLVKENIYLNEQEIKDYTSIYLQKDLKENENSDYWIIEFAELNEYSNKILTKDLLDEIKSLDESILLNNELKGKDKYGDITDEYMGYNKFYFDHIVDGKVIEHFRVDIGDGNISNKDEFEYLYEQIETRQKDSYSLENNFNQEEIVKNISIELTFSHKEKLEDIDKQKAKVQNYKISEDILPEKLTPSERLNNNIDAISMLKRLEKEERELDINAQETLSKYVGWGGLADVFDEKKEGQWKIARDFLKENLTEEEYKSAVESTLTAFYTPKVVIDNIYYALSNIGFKGGNILEPSMGIGNFIGNLPDEMSNSNIYGVELDSISGKIAKYLYPNANIQITGYEKTNFENDSFDLIIGNVPFGDFKVSDRNYDKNNFLIHDYFFAKSIDKVRTGGLIAFITSSGTMDKQDDSIRRYIGQRCNFLGAIRLPNNTFKGVAGTEVTSDIIFLQKREKERQVHSGLHNFLNVKQDKNGLSYNQYFIDNPKQVIGTMKEVSGRFGNTITCVADETSPFDEQLKNAINNIKGEYKKEIKSQNSNTEKQKNIELKDIPISDYKNFSYHLINDNIYYRQDNNLDIPKLSKTEKEKFKLLIDIRESAKDILESQINDISDNELNYKQANLNNLYDTYVEKFGYIKDTSKRFSKDSSYMLIRSLEKIDNDDIAKSDIFYKRTIENKKIPDKVDTSLEALMLSMSEKAKVDLEYMQNLTGFTKDTIISDLKDEIYLDISHYNKYNEKIYLTKDEYLSGDVRQKANEVQEYLQKNQNDTNEIIQIAKENYDKLKNVIPKDIEAIDISVQLGTTWIPTKYYNDFMYETFNTPKYLRNSIKILYSPNISTFKIVDSNRDRFNDTANMKYATSRTTAYQILENSLNLKDTNIYDTVSDDKGGKKQVINQSETSLARDKQDYLNNTFKDWIFKDKSRRDDLVKIYNEKFNSIVNREYDGSNMNFPNMNSSIKLKKHQKDAIMHTIFGGNTLLAHCVGAGKTYEMIASAMESKRLGLCNKSLFIVPNHLTSQTGTEFLKLYPNANILVADKKDFEEKNRKLFTSRIATGNYDAIIIGQTQFIKIPMSDDYQKNYIESQIDEISNAIRELKEDNGESFTIKELTKFQKKLKIRYEKLLESIDKDDVVTFEELGIDKIFVDEAHDFKNLEFVTKMRNISGINSSGSKRASDLFMKCRFLDEKTNNKGIVFATGTPISNSMTELYTMQKYLQYDDLVKNGHHIFDSWASNYGFKETKLELAPEGNGFRQKTRFSKYVNLPELMGEFKKIADVRTFDMLDLPVPKANYETILIKPSKMQKEIMQKLVERAKVVRDNLVSKEEDNLLKITNDGRKLALDVRLINPMIPKDENSKVITCANKVFEIYKNTEKEKLSQVIFCDTSTPANKEFNVYDELKKELIKKGINENEIAFIHDADTKEQKLQLFKKVSSGNIRVLIGSTSMMGTGANMQEKLIALHDLDCPYRPSDLEQRSGRIIRQGNDNENVYIFRYVTEGSFDAYLYQLLENKQKIISQVITSRTLERSVQSDDDIALSYAEIKALATGNPLIKEKVELDNEIRRLNALKSEHTKNLYDLQDKIEQQYPKKIQDLEIKVKSIENDIKFSNITTENKEFKGIAIKGQFYEDKKQAGEILLQTIKTLAYSDYNSTIGNYKNFDISARYNFDENKYYLTLKNNYSYQIELGNDIYGNFTRIDNKISSIPDMLNNHKIKLEEIKNQLEQAKIDVKIPFQKEDILQEKIKRLKIVEKELSLDDTKNIYDSSIKDSEKELKEIVISEDEYALEI